MNICNDIVKKCAVKAGFDMCGVSAVHSAQRVRADFDRWCGQGFNADMKWTLSNGDVRENPELILSGAKSVVCVGLSYLRDDSCSDLAMLAQGIDYHFVMKKMMSDFVELLKENCPFGFEVKICVDSAPVFEKYWAVKSGLGWIGRNSLVINREFGSFFVLGEIFIDKSCDRYDSESDFRGCAECFRCVSACPSSALADGRVDARKCISYLTIEHKGEFDDCQIDILTLRENKSFFGCELCQSRCPWNLLALKRSKEEKKSRIKEIFHTDEFDFSYETFLQISASEFRKKYRSTSLFRASIKNILRNIHTIF